MNDFDQEKFSDFYHKYEIRKFNLLEKQKYSWIPKNMWIPENLNFVPPHNHGFSLEIDYGNDEDNIVKTYLNLYTQLIERSKVDTNNKILMDISCGYGRGTDFLRRRYNFLKVYGVDLMPFHIEVAKEKYPDVNFLTLDVRDLKYLNFKVDVVTSVESLCYYQSDDRFYENLNCILNDDGIALITCFIEIKNLTIITEKFKRYFNVIVDDITKQVTKGCYELYLQYNNVKTKYNLSEEDTYIYKKLLHENAAGFIKDASKKVIFVNFLLTKKNV